MNNRPNICIKTVNINQICFTKGWLEFMLQEICILDTNSKGGNRTNVTKDSLFHIIFHLSGKLIRNNKIQFIFSCLRQNGSKVRGSKILKLINIQVKILTLFVGNILSTHSSS